eukprot:6246842-Prymnesium_polylepis.1
MTPHDRSEAISRRLHNGRGSGAQSCAVRWPRFLVTVSRCACDTVGVLRVQSAAHVTCTCAARGGGGRGIREARSSVMAQRRESAHGGSGARRFTREAYTRPRRRGGGRCAAGGAVNRSSVKCQVTSLKRTRPQ